ncbi:MAG: hypothetical protein KBT53_07990 [Porticoccus sp.]|nr:hypothetical protein [Porticoccus sp.]MBQ0808350.1 hypothetical protein [Porticoccus sp.]
MRINHRFFFYLVMALFLHGCSSTSTPDTSPERPSTPPSVEPVKSAKPPPTLDKAHFKQSIITKERDSGKTIVFSTINGFKKGKVNDRRPWGESYISAAVDKATGDITYQINTIVKYRSHKLHLYREVRYDSNGETKFIDATILERKVDCLESTETGAARRSGCYPSERVVFTLDQEQITKLSEGYTGDSQAQLRYTMLPRSGPTYLATLYLAEIAALVEAVEEYKKSLGL